MDIVWGNQLGMQGSDTASLGLFQDDIIPGMAPNVNDAFLQRVGFPPASLIDHFDPILLIHLSRSTYYRNYIT
jgi:hypothetical protein